MQQSIMKIKAGSIWGGYAAQYEKFAYGVEIGQRYLVENTTLGIPALIQTEGEFSLALQYFSSSMTFRSPRFYQQRHNLPIHHRSRSVLQYLHCFLVCQHRSGRSRRTGYQPRLCSCSRPRPRTPFRTCRRRVRRRPIPDWSNGSRIRQRITGWYAQECHGYGAEEENGSYMQALCHVWKSTGWFVSNFRYILISR